jgi:hypothetical protein
MAWQFLAGDSGNRLCSVVLRCATCNQRASLGKLLKLQAIVSRLSIS